MDKEGVLLDNPSLKGLARVFNSSTIRGRANVAKATFAGFFGIYLWMKIKNFGNDANDSKKVDQIVVSPETV